jgi:hypothetical protein
MKRKGVEKDKWDILSCCTNVTIDRTPSVYNISPEEIIMVDVVPEIMDPLRTIAIRPSTLRIRPATNDKIDVIFKAFSDCRSLPSALRQAI